MPIRRLRAVALAVVALVLAACGPLEKTASRHSTLTVFAASSLKNSFTAMGNDFEQSHPGVTVRFSFGGSADLAEQVNAGAPADVLATADKASLSSSKVPTAVHPAPFATNTLEIAVPHGNPA